MSRAHNRRPKYRRTKRREGSRRCTTSRSRPRCARGRVHTRRVRGGMMEGKTPKKRVVDNMSNPLEISHPKIFKFRFNHDDHSSKMMPPPPPPPVNEHIAKCAEVGGYDEIGDSECVRKYVYRTNRNIHQVLSRIKAINVVQYMDSEDCKTDSTRAWMSMKRYPKTMFYYVDRRNITVPWFKWMQQIAKCLYTMHTLGYVHRDVKYTNILIGQPEKDFNAFLGDFGNACRILGTPPKDDTGKAKSFPTFHVPPFSNQKHYNRPHDDWWAFGKLLYICLFQSTTLNDYQYEGQSLYDHIMGLQSTLHSQEDKKMFNAMKHCLLNSMKETDGAFLDSTHRLTTFVTDKTDPLGQQVCNDLGVGH